MEATGIGLMLVGTIIVMVGVIKFMMAAFADGALWGIGSLVLPVVALAYLILHWIDAWRPALTATLGYAIVILGYYLKTATVV